MNEKVGEQTSSSMVHYRGEATCNAKISKESPEVQSARTSVTAELSCMLKEVAMFEGQMGLRSDAIMLLIVATSWMEEHGGVMGLRCRALW